MKPRSRSLRRWSLLLASCCASCLAPSHRATEERAIRVETPALRSLHCATHNGELEVTGMPIAVVEGIATVTAYGDSEEEARENLKRLELVQDFDGSELRLKLNVPQDLDGDVAFRLTAPEAVMLLANTHNGAVKASAIGGGLRAATHNGAVELDRVSTPVHVDAHNGGVRGSIRGRELDVELRSHNGAIALRLDRDASAQVSATAHNGSISLSGATAMNLAEGSATGTYGEGKGSLKLATHNGQIAVRIE